MSTSAITEARNSPVKCATLEYHSAGNIEPVVRQQIEVLASHLGVWCEGQDIEKRYEDAEDEAIRAGEKIMERPYNTAPDAEAVNCQRLVLKTREACEDSQQSSPSSSSPFARAWEFGLEHWDAHW
eukprot:1230691-Amphidinium_carterae.2